MDPHHHSSLPTWTWIAPVFAGILVTLKLAHLVPADATLVLVCAAALLLAAVFAAVHHAEVLALKLGEPFGSILLAVAVTVIEVGLIASIMLSEAAGSDSVARDTVFAAVMIVLNGVVGLCLVLGGNRHFEQSFQLQAASSTLAVLGTLAVMTLMLPNFTLTTAGPVYAPVQLVVVGILSLVLWAVFVFVQTIRHRNYFLDEREENEVHAKPSDRIALIALGLLLVALVSVVLLAKTLSYPLDKAIAAAGLPKAFVGVVIAAIVLLPEAMAAANSALKNRLQNSINLALGSAVASIGLTIPCVAVLALVIGQTPVLGISPSNMTLLTLTLFVATLTLGTGRTTVLQGAIHLVIFAVFLLVSAVP
ncbi:MAG: ionic transporter y4hA [Hyphomicrobiales bacterium]|jgi:Ca2+:H+ antiporter|nr:ionic transporter y4hA [Hyphomicrobiales bacterium]